MRFALTRRAFRQIEDALAYVRSRSPQGAAAVSLRLEATRRLLLEFPEAGHPTQKVGVRRIGLAPYPYLIDYRVTRDEIPVLRFRHGARKPLD